MQVLLYLIVNRGVTGVADGLLAPTQIFINTMSRIKKKAISGT
jgi:hypothetical protein